MIEPIFALVINSLGNITISLIVYSYLLYTIFYKSGKFKIISDFWGLLKILFIFLAVYLLLTPLIIFIPAITNYIQGKPLPDADFFTLSGLFLVILILSILPWLMKSSNKKFDDIKVWFSMLYMLNIIFSFFLVLGLILSFFPQLSFLKPLRGSFMALIIMFSIFLTLGGFLVKLIPHAILNFQKRLNEERERNKNKIELNKSMKDNKESFWKKFKEKLIESEDNNLFGEIFLIIGGFLIIKWLETIIPSFNGKEWIYFGIGFLFILFGIKLVRKS